MGVFHLHLLTPLVLELDNSNFVQKYFAAKSVFCNEKDQIDSDVIMTSSFSDECRKLLKASILKSLLLLHFPI